MADKTLLTVEGMTCSSCAQGISRHLEKKGLQNVNVHFESKEVEFELVKEFEISDVISSIKISLLSL